MERNLTNNPKIEIDGATGITLVSERGKKGERGNMLFFSSMDNTSELVPYKIYDIWGTTEKREPLFTNVIDFYKDIVPIKNDGIICHTTTAYSMYIVSFIINSVEHMSEWEIFRKNVEVYINEGLLTERYAKFIFDYYKVSTPPNMICICRHVCELPLLSGNANSSKLYDFSIEVNEESIPYQFGLSGHIASYDEETHMGKPMLENESMSVYSFTINGENLENYTNESIIIEFIAPSQKAGMGTMLPAMWGNPENYQSRSKDFPFGYPGNYNHYTNYDDEYIGNFSVLIKKSGEVMEGNSFTAGIKLCKENILGYTGNIFVYSSNGDYKTKVFVGSFVIDSEI